MRLVNYYSNAHIKSFEIIRKHRHSLRGSWKREQVLQAQQDALFFMEALEPIKTFPASPSDGCDLPITGEQAGLVVHTADETPGLSSSRQLLILQYPTERALQKKEHLT